MKPSPPSAIGPYRITTHLGSGPHGETYVAMHAVRKQQVALKILQPGYFSQPQTVEKFLQGAAALAEAGLVHPQIAWLWEAGFEDGAVFLASRLIEGPSLEERLRQESTLNWEETLQILQRVGRALEFAHARGQAHGDLKPSNVVLSEQHGAALTDFGLIGLLQACCGPLGSEPLESGPLESGPLESGAPGSGALPGGPHYPLAGAPPAQPSATQLSATQPSTANDQYALACLAVEMLGGLGFSPLAESRGANQPATIAWPAGLPAALKNVLRRALSADTNRRYPSLALFTADLEKAIFQNHTELAAARRQRMESEANAKRLADEKARLEAEEAARLAGVEQVRRELEAELKAQEERVQSVQSGQDEPLAQLSETTEAAVFAPAAPTAAPMAAPTAAPMAGAGTEPMLGQQATSEAPPARRAPAGCRWTFWRGALLAALLAALAWAGWQWGLANLQPPAPTPTATVTLTAPAAPTTAAPAVLPATATRAPTETATPTQVRRPTVTRRPTLTRPPSQTPATTPTATPTVTPTTTSTSTSTATPTATSTATPTATPTATLTATLTATPTATPTTTPTNTPTRTPRPG